MPKAPRNCDTIPRDNDNSSPAGAPTAYTSLEKFGTSRNPSPRLPTTPWLYPVGLPERLGARAARPRTGDTDRVRRFGQARTRRMMRHPVGFSTGPIGRLPYRYISRLTEHMAVGDDFILSHDHAAALARRTTPLPLARRLAAFIQRQHNHHRGGDFGKDILRGCTPSGRRQGQNRGGDDGNTAAMTATWRMGVTLMGSIISFRL